MYVELRYSFERKNIDIHTFERFSLGQTRLR